MVTTPALMALAVMLFLKHLLADGPLQTSYQVKHKGTFLHPAGLMHAFIHAALTVVCLIAWATYYAIDLGFVTLLLIAALAAAEFVIHYFADFAKVQVDRRFKWSRMEITENGEAALVIVDNQFFIAFLVDQTIHSLTYIVIVWLVGTLPQFA